MMTQRPARGEFSLKRAKGRFLFVSLEERRVRRNAKIPRRAERMRLELRVPKRVCKRAVDRNRLRRRLREGLRRLELQVSREQALVVNAFASARDASAQELWQDLTQTVKKAGIECAASV